MAALAKNASRLIHNNVAVIYGDRKQYEFLNLLSNNTTDIAEALDEKCRFVAERN